MAERDPARTRAQILAAALAEFATRGPAGARVDAIAAAARVNKRMLYHYFGSKEGLLAALLETQCARLPADFYQADETLAAWLPGAQRRLLAAGSWVRLALWQGLAGAPATLPDEAAWRPARAAIERAQAAGALPAGLDSTQLLLSFIALVLLPVALPELTRAITGAAPDDPRFVTAREAFLVALGGLLEGSGPKPRYRLTPRVTRGD